MLFTDKSKLEFVFSTPAEGQKGYRFNHSTMDSNQLNSFLTKKLLKVKIVSKRKALYDVYTIEHNIVRDQFSTDIAQYQTVLEGQYLLQLMVAKFIDYNQKNKL